MKKSTFEVKLDSTESYLRELYSKKELKIKSEYPTINELNCILEKGENCFKFLTEKMNFTKNMADYQYKQYGYLDNFHLINEDYNLILDEGNRKINIQIGKGFTCKGEFWKLKSFNYSNEKKIYRSLIPMNQYVKSPHNFIETLPFKIKDNLRFAGYFNIIVDEITIGIYDYNILGVNYLIIENYEEIEGIEFKNLVINILHTYSIISGYLIYDEIITLNYENNSFDNVLGFNFEKLKKTLISIPIVDNGLFNDLSDKVKVKLLLPETFQKLILNNKKDKRIFRAVRIINESSDNPIEIIASTYSVALETLKNVIIEENEEKINPFKNKTTASIAIKKLKEIINNINENEFNNKNSILNKIEQLNQVGNKESFILCFKLLNIVLSDSDIDCLAKRNDFLHGRIPFENENDDFELKIIVYKLHQLICSLILKKADYNGLILNNAKYIDLERGRNKLKEKLFIKI